MTTRYQSKHYEDVAAILRRRTSHPPLTHWCWEVIGRDFANLFAADNPKRCTFHGEHDTGYSEDCKITGFDPEQFLAACGHKRMDGGYK